LDSNFIFDRKQLLSSLLQPHLWRMGVMKHITSCIVGKSAIDLEEMIAVARFGVEICPVMMRMLFR